MSAFRYAFLFCGSVRVRRPSSSSSDESSRKVCWLLSACPFYVGITVLVGGVAASGCEQPGVGIVDLATGTSVELQVDAGVPAADICLYHHCSNFQEAEAERPRIFVFGGGGNCFSFGCHFSKHCLEIDVTMAIDLMSKGENGA